MLELLSSNDEDDEENLEHEEFLAAMAVVTARKPRVWVRNYSKEIVSSLLDVAFQQHFRVACSAFESVLASIPTKPESNPVTTHGGLPPIPQKTTPDHLVGPWKQESFWTVADRFDVSRSTSYAAMKHVVTVLCRDRTVVKLLTGERMRHAMDGF